MRRTALNMLMAAGFFACLVAEAQKNPIPGTVAANRLNVRAKPALNSAMVGNMSIGDPVKIYAQEGEWYQIDPPQDSDVFISKSFVKDGVVVKRANIRSGPSVSFESYGFLQPGAKIEIVNDKREEWYKIAPPPEVKVWANSRFIQITQENAAKLPKAKPGEPRLILKNGASEPELVSLEEKKEVAEKTAPSEGVILAEEDTKDEDKIPFVDGGEKQVELEGIIFGLDDQNTPYVTHALTRLGAEDFETVCYLHGRKVSLKEWESKRAVVKGKQRQVQDWKYPVVDVESISTGR